MFSKQHHLPALDTNQTTSSVLIANALGITKEPDLGPLFKAEHDMTCNYCRRTIKTGETFGRHEFRSSFNNGADMLPDGTGEICWHCLETSAIPQLCMAPLYKSVFTPAGVFALHKNDHIYSFLMHPEQVTYPSVVLYGDAKSQILSWRADITLGPDLIKIQHGNNRLSIRPARLKSMLSANAAIIEKLNSGSTKKSPPLISVFRQLNGKEDPTTNPGLRADVIDAAATDPDISALLQIFLKANLGEIWAFFKCLNNFKSKAEILPMEMTHNANKRYVPKVKAEEVK